MRRAGCWMALAVAAGCSGGRRPPPREHRPTPYAVQLPANVAPMPVPADNPLTVEGVELGRHLFYDPILSGDNTKSCASCHEQGRGFTDGRVTAIGVRGQKVRRNTMALVNLAWSAPYFWDGRAATLEELVPIPIRARDELDQDLDALVAELQAHRDYPAWFARAFPGEPISPAAVGKAIAQFLRILVSFDSPIDRFHRGEYRMTEQEQRGQKLLSDPLPRGAPEERRDLCDRCHRHDAGLLSPDGFGMFTDGTFRNNGLAPGGDRGRGEATRKLEDDRRFKVPTIRNIAVTGPYMHDGRFATLADVLRHYNGGIGDGADEVLTYHGAAARFGLSEQELADVAASLALFTDERFLTNPAYSNPFEPPRAGASVTSPAAP